MIRFDHVTFTYPDASQPALADVDLTSPEGELCLVVGRTGAGKSTLLRAVNGLVPHFTGGTLRGQVIVDGRSTATAPPRELADLVGVVGQDPTAGLRHRHRRGRAGLRDGEPRRRARRDAPSRRGRARPARHRRPAPPRPAAPCRPARRSASPSASVLTAAPRVLVLDEPTSALDPGAAEEVLAALTRLVARPRPHGARSPSTGSNASCSTPTG